MVQINGTEFLIGCDPEVFVVNADGQPVSAHGMIPGTKEQPHFVDNGMVQVDGMALEFGIEPAEDAKSFIYNIRSVMATMTGMLPEGHQLLLAPTVEFSREVIEAQPKEALELGCEPDYNAYTLATNPRPRPPSPGLRSAGGHVHVGWGWDFDKTSRPFMESCGALVQELDWYLGVPSMAWDSDHARRELYGAAGAFRPKSYGLEYRTLSNQWLRDDETIEYVFNQTIKAVQSCVNNAMQPKTRTLNHQCGAVTVRDMINTNMVQLGKEVFCSTAI